MKIGSVAPILVRIGAGLLVLGACAAILHMLVYMNVLGFGLPSLAVFPRSITYLVRTTASDMPVSQHPLEELAGRLAEGPREASGPIGRRSSEVPYRHPMADALAAVVRSMFCVALALIWIAILSAVRLIVRNPAPRATGPGRVGLAALGCIDRLAEQLQRLPGLIIYLLVYAVLRLFHGNLPEALAGQALVLSLVLANSDGIVPDLADVMRQRFRDIEARDYVKAGVVVGQRRLALMGRELALTASDLLGGRILQIVGGAFLLELLIRYPGIGRACVLNLYGPSAGGTAASWWAYAIADNDLLYCMLLVLLFFSLALLSVRRLVQTLLDPRPRTGLAL